MSYRGIPSPGHEAYARSKSVGFWSAPAERSGDGAFEAERSVRLIGGLHRHRKAASNASTFEKRCRAALATALQNVQGGCKNVQKVPWPHAPEHRLSTTRPTLDPTLIQP